MSEARHDLLPVPGAPVIRLVGDARFPKVTVFRGGHNPAIAWQHHLARALA